MLAIRFILQLTNFKMFMTYMTGLAVTFSKLPFYFLQKPMLGIIASFVLHHICEVYVLCFKVFFLYNSQGLKCNFKVPVVGMIKFPGPL